MHDILAVPACCVCLRCQTAAAVTSLLPNMRISWKRPCQFCRCGGEAIIWRANSKMKAGGAHGLSDSIHGFDVRTRCAPKTVGHDWHVCVSRSHNQLKLCQVCGLFVKLHKGCSKTVGCAQPPSCWQTCPEHSACPTVLHGTNLAPTHMHRLRYSDANCAHTGSNTGHLSQLLICMTHIHCTTEMIRHFLLTIPQN